MTKRLLVTSGLPYSNGRLHVGHIAGAYLPADIYVRFKRLQGIDVRYICGSDDHGVPNLLAAQKEGKPPKEISGYYNKLQQEDFASIGISFDTYGATCSNRYHHKASQDFFLSLEKQGLFEKQTSEQFYDESRSMFLPDRYVTGTCGYCDTPDQNSDQCENCGKLLDIETLKEPKSVLSGNPAVIRETVHWFLDLSRFEKDVDEWLESAIVRDHTKNYVKGLISTGLVKISMTRDLDWGVPVPLEDPDAKDKVLYVWFDAPIGYVSNTMELCDEVDGDPEKYTDWWKSDDTEILHFVGEDNTIFHCVIWIAMLKSEGSYRLPKGVVINQYVNFQKPGQEEEKMSKSRGTAVWIGEYIAEGNNPDSLRYYLNSIAPERSRSAFNPEDLVQRNNSDLANTLGNFVNRVVSFTKKYVGEFVPEYDQSKTTEIDQKLLTEMEETHTKITELLENFQNKAAQETLFHFIRSCNKYIDEKAPWKTRKDDMEATLVTLATGLHAIKFISIASAPFIPFTAEKMQQIFLLKGEEVAWDSATTPLSPKALLGETSILFEKIES